jgi:hypothetical protein
VSGSRSAQEDIPVIASTGTAGVVLFVALVGAAKGCLTLVRPS